MWAHLGEGCGTALGARTGSGGSGMESRKSMVLLVHVRHLSHLRNLYTVEVVGCEAPEQHSQ